MDIIGVGIDAIEKESLLNDVQGSSDNQAKELPIQSISLGHYQPRQTTITEESLEEIAASIKEQGVLQPVIVRQAEQGYELIAGERRLRASTLAGLKQIPCVIKAVTPQAAYAIAIIENVQRKQLNVLEEAAALRRLRDQYNFTSDEVAQSVGRPRTTVTNLIRLSEKLCQNGKQLLRDQKIDFGHARTVLSLNEDEQARLLEQVVLRQLSVRQLEQLVAA